MNKRTRLVVSVLFAVIILLAVGITRFYVGVSDNTGNNGSSTRIVQKLAGNSSGNRIFEGENALYGVIDSNDKVIVAPEWTELSFVGENLCTASKRIGGRLLTGCINLEGNTVVPFIYRNINRYSQGGFVFYIAESDADSSYVVYDEDFKPCFMRSWETCSVNDSVLTLGRDNSVFTYTYGENGFVCTGADVAGNAMDIDFMLNINSRLLLSKLSCTMLETISARVSDYLEFAFTKDTQALSRLAEASDAAGFAPLFPEDSKIITKRLLGISDIFIYSVKSDAGAESYAVSVIVNTRITYTADDGTTQLLDGSYKAIVRFVPSGSGITAVSGGFVKPEPDYPDEYVSNELPQEEAATAP